VDGVFDATARTILSGTGGLVGGDLAWNSSGVRTSGKGVALTSKGLLGHNGTHITFTVDATTGEATLMGVEVLNSSGTVLLSSGMSPSAIANTANAVGGNRLSNSMPTIGSTGPFYVSWGNTGQTCIFQEGFSSYRPDHTGGVCFYFSGTPANGTVQDVSYGNATDGWTPFPVVAGSTYEFSAYIGAHRCNACVLIEWYNSSGTAIAASTGTWNYQVASTGPLSSYGRYGGIATAPAGSAYVRVSIRAEYLGVANPYTFFSMMYFGEAGSSQTAFSAWSDGNPGRITPNMASTYIANLAVDTLQIAGNAVTVPIVCSGGVSSTFTSNGTATSDVGGASQLTTGLFESAAMTFGDAAGAVSVTFSAQCSTEGYYTGCRCGVIARLVNTGTSATVGTFFNQWVAIGLDWTAILSAVGKVAIPYAGTFKVVFDMGNNWNAGTWELAHDAAAIVMGVKR
jgi:hypothetical protein